MDPLPLLKSCQEIHQTWRPYVANIPDHVSLLPIPQTGRSPFVSRPQVFVQCIHTYPQCRKSVSSSSDVRIHHTVETRDPLNMVEDNEMQVTKAKTLRI
jgi:hypothetical protein